MERSKKIVFDIISGDDMLIKEVVKNYNETYKTDFKIVEFIYDEVVFARIETSTYKTSDIFNLGYQLGSTAQYKREKGEIDW